MQFEAGNWYHVYNRGNNSNRIFFNRENYLFFLKKMRKQILPFADVIAYCLMPNHFHWLLRVKEKTFNTRPTALSDRTDKTFQIHPLVRKIAVLLSSYTQAVNRQENRTGSLFQQKTKAKCLNSPDDFKSSGELDYALICFHYIHQNPVRAGLVQVMGEWEFSSYQDYAGLRDGTLPAKEFVYEWFGLKQEEEFAEMSQQTLDPDLIIKCF